MAPENGSVEDGARVSERLARQIVQAREARGKKDFRREEKLLPRWFDFNRLSPDFDFEVGSKKCKYKIKSKIKNKGKGKASHGRIRVNFAI